MLNRSKSSTSMSIATLILSAIIVASIFVIPPINVYAAHSDDTVLLTTLGYTTGQSLLVTHMAVGTLADACASKVYKADEASNLINTYLNITNGLKEQLSKLLAAKTLQGDDVKFIQSTIEVLDLVLKESQDLKAYIASGTKENAEAYNNSRKKALREIKTLLDIKD